MSGALDRVAAAGAIRPLDLHFARWLAVVGGEAGEGVQLAAALVSQRVGAGDVCVDLSACAGRALWEAGGPAVAAPPLDAWRAELLGSQVVGRPGAGTPLVLDERDRLYLARYWRYEQDLAEALRARAGQAAEGVDRARLAADLARFFPAAAREPDDQAVAAALAVLQRLAVISGGPGTGKTRTVAAVLALLARQGATGRRVALAAPTGKAAARLGEAVRRACAELPLSAQERAAVPQEALTLHRLLGARADGTGFRHGPANPLHADTVVVDEASMVDLPLMSRLAGALPRGARLILLGDRDQLASVEAGAVLGDICGPARAGGFSPALAAALGRVLGRPVEGRGAVPAAPMADSVALLRRSYRFAPDTAIGALALQVNAGDAEAVLTLLRAAAGGVALEEVGETRLPARLAEAVVPHFRAVLAAEGPAEALSRLGTLRVLCPSREGPGGVAQTTAIIEGALARAGLIPREGADYRGRPILVTRNDYALELFNGDVGVLWPDPGAGGRLRAWFEHPGRGLRPLSPARLPPHETVYAMTVHKSQGSEFDRVLLVLPGQPSPVLTRELVYTAVTRARQAVSVWGAGEVLAAAVRARVERASGLREALWGPP